MFKVTATDSKVLQLCILYFLTNLILQYIIHFIVLLCSNHSKWILYLQKSSESNALFPWQQVVKIEISSGILLENFNRAHKPSIIQVCHNFELLLSLFYLLNIVMFSYQDF